MHGTYVIKRFWELAKESRQPECADVARDSGSEAHHALPEAKNLGNHHPGQWLSADLALASALHACGAASQEMQHK